MGGGFKEGIFGFFFYRRYILDFIGNGKILILLGFVNAKDLSVGLYFVVYWGSVFFGRVI